MILTKNLIGLNSPKKILFKSKKDSNRNSLFNLFRKMRKTIEISLNQGKPLCLKKVQGTRLSVKEDRFIV
jgi:hypothetical protein